MAGKYTFYEKVENNTFQVFELTVECFWCKTASFGAQNGSLKTFLCAWRVNEVRKHTDWMCANVDKAYGVDSEFLQVATWQENPLFDKQSWKIELLKHLSLECFRCKRASFEAHNGFLKTFLCAWRVYTSRKHTIWMCLNVYKAYGLDSEFPQAVTWQENPFFCWKNAKSQLDAICSLVSLKSCKIIRKAIF